MSTVAEPERAIVGTLERSVGTAPVILCGSRATGEAHEDSDYDLLVVLPFHRVLLALRGLDRMETELEHQLGVPVTINPLPRFRLRRPGRSMLVWKVRREGVLLTDPARFVLQPDDSQPTREMRESYAVSGLRYLISELLPAELARGQLSPAMRRVVRKALLHAVQLRLLRDGRYAPSLREGLAHLDQADDPQLLGAAEEIDRPESWFGVRDALEREIGEPQADRTDAWARNLQYTTLSLLRGKGQRLESLGSHVPVGRLLSDTVRLLCRAVLPGGEIDPVTLSAAADSLPRFLRRSAPMEWSSLRDIVEGEWPQANPLLGL